VSRKKTIRKARKPATTKALAELALKYASAGWDPDYAEFKNRLDAVEIWSKVRASEQGKTAETWLWIDKIARRLLKTGKYLRLSKEFDPGSPPEKARAKLRKFVHRYRSDIEARMTELQKK
jgi:hypothetical protein